MASGSKCLGFRVQGQQKCSYVMPGLTGSFELLWDESELHYNPYYEDFPEAWDTRDVYRIGFRCARAHDSAPWSD